MTTAVGLYFDGVSSARHAVTVEATGDGVRIRGADGAAIADWAYAALRAMSSPDDVLRLGAYLLVDGGQLSSDSDDLQVTFTQLILQVRRA